jgi:hypothetical protein
VGCEQVKRCCDGSGFHATWRIARDAGFDAKQLKELACAMRREKGKS